jgi:hypothetical protein
MITLFDQEFCGYGRHVPEHGPVDFNWDGDTDDYNVKKDINRDGRFSLLHGHDDWANLLLPIGTTGNFIDGLHATTQVEDDWLGLSIKDGDEIADRSVHSTNNNNVAAAISSDANAAQSERPTRKTLKRNLTMELRFKNPELNVADIDSLFARSAACDVSVASTGVAESNWYPLDSIGDSKINLF